MTRVVARLGRLDAVLAPVKPGINYWPVHVRYVVDKFASGQILLGVLQISQLVSFPPCSKVRRGKKGLSGKTGGGGGGGEEKQKKIF